MPSSSRLVLMADFIPIKVYNHIIDGGSNPDAVAKALAIRGRVKMERRTLKTRQRFASRHQLLMNKIQRFPGEVWF